MKRILYIAAMASLLMTSCQKTDVLNVVEDTIDFSTQVGKLTKAESDKLGTLKTQGFRVRAFADFDLGNDVNGKVYRGINGLSVEHSDSDKKWAITGNQKYFWPQSGNFLQFYTLSSNDDTWLGKISSDTHLLPAGDKKATEITGLDLPEYTVSPGANDDVMVADHIRQDKSNSKTVEPLFRHTMTKVEFNFKAGGEASETDAEEASVIILKGITTDKLFDKGFLDVTYSVPADGANAATPLSFEWTPIESSKTTFKGIPTETLTIVKKGGALVEFTESAPTTVEEGKRCYIKEGETVRKIYACTNGAWSVVETHTLTEGVWKSDKEADNSDETKAMYETFVGTVLTGELKNFVTWYMIPQSIELVETKDSEAGRVRIDYVADGVHIEQYFGLKGSVVTEWSEELCVRYNVTVAPHKIQFSPTVGAWDKFGATTEKPEGTDIEMQN